MDRFYALALILTVAAVTASIRFLPFVLFRNHTPGAILYLGRVLPYAIMGMLVVYCLKGVSVTQSPYGLPEGLSVALVVVLHRWKHNTFLSILAGTAVYMLLTQLVF